MQWEAILMQFPDGVATDEIPADWQPPEIGSPAVVKSLLQEAFPQADHTEGRCLVKNEAVRVEFRYAPLEEAPGAVATVTVRANPDLEAIPILKSAAERLGCRVFDAQTWQFADFGPQTEASLTDFAELHRRVNTERRWALAVSVMFVTTLHGLQDSGAVPAVKPLSKVATGMYGFLGLVALNLVAFLSSVVIALGQLWQLKADDKSPEEQDQIAEGMLAPALQGRGRAPWFIARWVHIPVAGLCGMIAGSVLAWGVSLLFF